MITSCQTEVEGTSTPILERAPVTPQWVLPGSTPSLTENAPAPTTSRSSQPSRVGETEPEILADQESSHDPWEAGGPKEAPKPTADLVIFPTPGYLERLEPDLPFLESPQLQDLKTLNPEEDSSNLVDNVGGELTAAGEPSGELILPDLYTLPPYDLRQVRDDATGRTIVRFSNAIANLGPGALELRGKMDSNANTVDVLQRIFISIEEEEASYMETGAGLFHYHPEHEHWHWDSFSLYEVYSVLTDGSLGELIYTSDKVGYCLRDDEPVEEHAEGELSAYPSQFRRYGNCGPSIQGLSVGWADIYAHDTPGQWVDVTGLPEGEIYALRSTANPHQLIRETDKANNSAVIYFRLIGTQVELIEDW